MPARARAKSMRERLRQSSTFLGIAAGSLVLAAAFLGLSLYRNAHAREHLRALHWVSGKTPLLLAEEALTELGGGEPRDAVVHLAALRAADGALLARVPVEVGSSFLGASPSGLWFSEPGGLGIHRRDRRTLAVAVTQDAWREKELHVPAPLRPEGPLDPARGIPVRFADGKVQWLDPETLDLRPARDEPLSSWHDHAGSVDLVDPLRGGAPTVPIGRLHGQAELVTSPTDGKALQCSGKAASTAVFFEPRFLVEAGEKSGVLLDGPEFLLLHHTTPGAETSLALSRVDCAGRVRWTLPLGDPFAPGSLRAPGLLFLATRSQAGQDRLRAVSLETGAVAWSYP